MSTTGVAGLTLGGGLVAWPFSEAGKVLRFFRDFAATVPDEVFLSGAALTGPDGSKPVAIAAAHCGTPADGECVLGPIKAFGTPALDALGPIPYSQLNMMLDEGLQAGSRNYWKSSFLPALSDEAIETWTRDSYAAFQPYLGSHRYLNYMDRDDANDAALVAVYGPNLARLKRVKTRYDPDNVFHLNVNIPPA